VVRLSVNFNLMIINIFNFSFTGKIEKTKHQITLY
jgi:hypothetical protein